LDNVGLVLDGHFRQTFKLPCKEKWKRRS
jgi:hypothetical protein